jgi:arginase family enzyme
MKPRILDFDSSVLPLADERRFSLRTRQEDIRFGCRKKTLQALEADIGHALLPEPDTVFMGSGDYHHLSYALIRQYATLGKPIQVVVFDNHPDNMRYPFGIHCGSWVYHVSRLPFVAQVNVLGITSTDVEAFHSWENHLTGLRSGRIRYWCIGRDLDWMRSLGIRQSNSFDSCGNLLEAFESHLKAVTLPIYLSIDKDVLSPRDAHTNWDQGVMRLSEMWQAMDLMQERVIASDVTGEVSVYQYQSKFKQLLSDMDDQPEIDKEDLLRWQTEHQAINQQIIDHLG